LKLIAAMMNSLQTLASGLERDARNLRELGSGLKKPE
jgi:hypothetical protein